MLTLDGDGKGLASSLTLTGETEAALCGAFSTTGTVGSGLSQPFSSTGSCSNGRFCRVEGTGFRRGEVFGCAGKACGGETAAIAPNETPRSVSEVRMTRRVVKLPCRGAARGAWVAGEKSRQPEMQE